MRLDKALYKIRDVGAVKKPSHALKLGAQVVEYIIQHARLFKLKTNMRQDIENKDGAALLTMLKNLSVKGMLTKKNLKLLHEREIPNLDVSKEDIDKMFTIFPTKK